MKNQLKGIYLLISSLIIGLMALPAAFAKSARSSFTFFEDKDSTIERIKDSVSFTPKLKTVYDSLHLNISGLSQQAFDFAKEGMAKLIAEGKLMNDSIISIVDFSLPSTQKRLFILDIKNYKIIFNTLVAHGRNSGKEMANSFSNQNASYKSSPGFYVTGETYQGKNGYSLKLEGQENGVNDNALNRGIVIHGADYVNQDLANAQGYIGRSQGCPAVPRQFSSRIINAIKEGTCLFIYHPSYVRQSHLLN